MSADFEKPAQESKRPRPWRWRRVFWLLVAVLGATLANLVLWVAYSTNVPQMLANQIENRVHELGFSRVEGSLATGITIRRIIWYADPEWKTAVDSQRSIRFSARDVRIEISPAALLSGTLALKISAGDLVLRDPAEPQPEMPRPVPEWPVIRHPGRIEISDIEVGAFRTQNPDGEELAVIWERLRIARLASDRAGIRIEGVEVRLPDGHVSAAGALKPVADWSVDLAVEAEMQAGEGQRATVRAKLDGDLASAWTVQAQLRAGDPDGVGAEIKVNGGNLLDPGLAIRHQLELTEGSLEPWVSGLPGVRLAGGGSGSIGAAGLSLRGSFQVTPAAGESWKVEPDLIWQERTLRLAESPFERADGAIRGSAGGTIVLDDDGEPEEAIVAVAIQVSPGALLPDDALNVRAAAVQASWRSGHLDVRGNVQLGEDPDGILKLSVTTPWNPEDPLPDLEAHIEWSSLAWRGWRSADGRAVATGGLESWKVEGNGGWHAPAAPELPGRLDFAVEGALGQVERIRLTGSAGVNHLHVEGRLFPEWNLDWRVEIPDLAHLHVDLAGQFSSEGRLRGSQERPDLTFAVAGESLLTPGLAVARIAGGGALVAAAEGAREVRLVAEGIEVGGWTGYRLEARLRGEDLRLEASVDLASSAGEVNVAASGEGGADGWAGRLIAARWNHPELGAWSLRAPVEWAGALDRLEVAPATLQRDDGSGRVSAGGRWSVRSGVQAALEVDLLPWTLLQPWLPAGFEYAGDFGGAVILEWPVTGEPRIDWNGRLGPGSWSQSTADGPVALLRWHSAVWDGRWAAGQLQGAGRFDLLDGGDLRTRFEIPILDRPDRPAEHLPWQVEVAGTFSNFDLVPALIPDISALRGRAEVDLTLAGTRRDPRLSGSLRLVDGTAALPRLGLRLSAIELGIDGGWDQVEFGFSAQSGPGRLQGKGTVRMGGGSLEGTATLEGEEVEVLRVPEADVRFSPQLQVSLAGRTVRIDGTVRVPHGRLRPPDWSGAILPTEDEVLVGASTEARSDSPWQVQGRVRLILGDVRFRGYGLESKVGGEVTGVMEPGYDLRATGELRIDDGRYAAWGQSLEVERGRLLFTGGNLLDPGLDVRAVRRPRDVVVGVDLRGPLREPEMRLFSEPPMPNSEVLSWLLFGSPLTQTTGDEQQMLSRTASTAGLAGGEFLLRQVGRRIGLDEVAIEQADDPDAATVVVGRYLSPRLFVAYGLGIFEPTSLVRLRFQIDSRWSVEAEAGERANSTDLRYSIER